MGFILFVIFGEQIFRAINRPIPGFYQKIQENKWMWCMGTFFIGNQISTSLISTGAFEIYINDKLAFSKLETGRMPDSNTLQRVFS